MMSAQSFNAQPWLLIDGSKEGMLRPLIISVRDGRLVCWREEPWRLFHRRALVAEKATDRSN